MDRLMILMDKAENHGLLKKWYWNENFENQIKSSSADAQLVEKLLVEKQVQILQDLQMGRVRPESIGEQVRIKNKTQQDSFSQNVQKYLSEELDVDTTLNSLSPKNQVYRFYLNLFMQLKERKNNWLFPPKSTRLTTLKMGQENPQEPLKYLRQKLNFLGYKNDIEITVFDTDLEQLVILFQTHRKLAADGVVGPSTWRSLNLSPDHYIQAAVLNLDRARWLPDQLGREFIFVNLANQNFKMIRNQQTIFDFNTINGRLDRQTPLLIDQIRTVVLNPTWTVPFSIFVKDKLPEIQKDINYIQKMNIKVIDDITGKEVDPSTVDWQSQQPENLPYTLVQKPGPWNALGFIKFPLQNPYAIYLHDTDDRSLFEKNVRLFSSGCVRVEKPFELAEVLLENQKWNLDQIKNFTELSPIQATDQTWLKVRRPVPVYLQYQTLLQNSEGQLIIVPDFYELDQKMWQLSEL